MKVKIRYDDSFQTVEVTEEECESMIRADYEERRASAEDPAMVKPRTMQEILDAEFNHPEYNNYKHEHRYTLSADARTYEGMDYADIFGNPQFVYERNLVISDIQAAIAALQPQQRDLLSRVLFEKERPSDIARELGVSRQAIDQKLARIYGALKKNLKNSKNF